VGQEKKNKLVCAIKNRAWMLIPMDAEANTFFLLRTLMLKNDGRKKKAKKYDWQMSVKKKENEKNKQKKKTKKNRSIAVFMQKRLVNLCSR
jgi:hypothetical protein